MPIFNDEPCCRQHVPGYPGLWPNGDAGCFDPAVAGATYIVSRDDGALTVNDEGALWHYMWLSDPAGVLHES